MPPAPQWVEALTNFGIETLEHFPLGLNREDSQRLVNERVYRLDSISRWNNAKTLFW
jgi:hypothetical protein